MKLVEPHPPYFRYTTISPSDHAINYERGTVKNGDKVSLLLFLAWDELYIEKLASHNRVEIYDEILKENFN